MSNTTQRVGAILALALFLAPVPLSGQQADSASARPDTVPAFSLTPLVVEGRIDNLAGIAVTASEGRVGFKDLLPRPLLREGELLETVPGVIMTQHSGDGKSNQMFVRGFNLDHGTDFATWVEGMPVNIPTHAHGQGYTDLNFLTPEFVDYVSYELGSAHAEAGDFSSAGQASFNLRRSLDAPIFQLGAGEFGFTRLVAAGSWDVGSGTLIAGGETKVYDGPWDVPQDLRKLSGMLTYSGSAGRHGFSVTGLAYQNRWDGSDQIPNRAVEDGLISRFAQVDTTLGGESSRYSLSGSWSHTDRSSSQRASLYGIRYDLDLFSNFTYLLDDPLSGDQIRQRDSGRWTLGGSYAHAQPLQAFGRSHELTLGLQTRYDLADVALARTDGRDPVSTVRRDDVGQWSGGLYGSLESWWSQDLRTVLGLRGDVLHVDVASDKPLNSGTRSGGLVSPKASVAYGFSSTGEAYVSGGFGFHSNDARGAVQSVDPVTGEAVDAVDPLVQSRSAEIGVRLSPLDRWRTTAVLWTVGLESELLFVGDAGTTEPNGATRRLGFTLTNFYRLSDALSADLDISLAEARFVDAPTDEDHVPGALENVIAAGVSWEPAARGLFWSMRLRHFGAYPLVEDNSVRANGTSLVNLAVGYRFGAARLRLGLLNLFDSESSDIQYFYGSRLGGEPLGGVEDVHFHPVEPRQIRVQLSWGL
jgi:hypothetical protein